MQKFIWTSGHYVVWIKPDLNGYRFYDCINVELLKKQTKKNLQW